MLENQIKFSEIKEQSLKLAKCLFDLGLKRDDVVAIVSENRIEYPAIAFAVLLLGGIVLPVNLTYTEREYFLFFYIVRLDKQLLSD